MYYKYKDKFEIRRILMDSLSAEEPGSYQYVGKAKRKSWVMANDEGVDLSMLKRVVNACIKSDSILQNAMGKKEYTGNELDTFQAKDMESQNSKICTCFICFKENHIMDMTNTTFMTDFTEQAISEEKKMEIRKRSKKLSRGYCSG